MFVLLRVVRGVIGVLFVFQIFGMLPVLTWFQNPEAIGGHHIVQLVIKILAAAIFGALFFGMRSFINWLHQKKHGTPHPALAVKKLAL